MVTVRVETLRGVGVLAHGQEAFGFHGGDADSQAWEPMNERCEHGYGHISFACSEGTKKGVKVASRDKVDVIVHAGEGVDILSNKEQQQKPKEESESIIEFTMFT